MNPLMKRRTLLKAMAAAGALGSLPLLNPSRLLAAPEDVPLRMVFFHLHSGVLRTSWQPTSASGGAPTRDDWKFAPVMQAMQKYQGRTNIFRNLEMISSIYDSSNPANAHFGGLTHYMTGDGRVPGQGTLAGGRSVDQYIAREIARQGILTRLSSLEISCSNHRSSNNLRVWPNPGQAARVFVSPEDVYNRAFSSLNLTPEQLARGEQSRAFIRQQSLYSASRLGAQDRQVVQSHLELREQLFERVKVRSARDANALSQEDFQTKLNEFNARNPTQWSASCKLNAQLAAYALHSDATRVVNLGLEEPPPSLYNYNPGRFNSDNVHDLDHLVSGNPSRLDPMHAPGGGGHAAIVRQQQIQFEKLAEFLDLLDTMPETDGKTLLDHTVVVVVSHIADGSHALSDLPWMTIGDAHGFFKTGQYIELERKQHPKHKSKTIGRGHNDLFVSLIQSMGLQAQLRDPDDEQSARDRFGNKDACSGPILQVHA